MNLRAELFVTVMSHDSAGTGMWEVYIVPIVYRNREEPSFAIYRIP